MAAVGASDAVSPNARMKSAARDELRIPAKKGEDEADKVKESCAHKEMELQRK
mgnify:CR=1 FL=1